MFVTLISQTFVCCNETFSIKTRSDSIVRWTTNDLVGGVPFPNSLQRNNQEESNVFSCGCVDWVLLREKLICRTIHTEMSLLQLKNYLSG